MTLSQHMFLAEIQIRYFRENDEDNEQGNLRNINHHGKSITVDQNGRRLVQKIDSWMAGFMNNGYSIFV